MKRKEWLDAAARTLEAAGVPDPALDAQWLLSQIVGEDRLPLLLTAAQTELTPAQEAELSGWLTRRANREPLQYVLGEAWFMGRRFLVDPRVLIPRADTEVLCQAALDRLRPGQSALDVGTGSGALAVTLALERPGAAVTALDISLEALAVARENARLLGAQVQFLRSDLFSALTEPAFDLVVSNPPYIPTGELESLQREVRQEPRLALDGGVDGMACYRRILAELPGVLRRGGSLLLEAGDGEAEALAALCAAWFEKVECLRDLSGLPRVVALDGYGRKHAG